MSTPQPTKGRWVVAITLAQGVAALLMVVAELRDRRNAGQRHVHVRSMSRAHRRPHLA